MAKKSIEKPVKGGGKSATPSPKRSGDVERSEIETVKDELSTALAVLEIVLDAMTQTGESKLHIDGIGLPETTIKAAQKIADKVFSAGRKAMPKALDITKLAVAKTKRGA